MRLHTLRTCITDSLFYIAYKKTAAKNRPCKRAFLTSYLVIYCLPSSISPSAGGSIDSRVHSAQFRLIYNALQHKI